MSTPYRCACRGLLALAALLAATLAHSQNLSIAEANSSNDRVYSLGNIGTANVTTTYQNTDAGSFTHIQSLAFLANPSSKALDLIVADTGGGKIAVYPGYFASGDPTTATVIWTAAQGGPAAPDGLSVDLAGDLFVVSSSAGNAQLWVFPAAGTAACTTGVLTTYAPLCNPRRVDNGFTAGQVLVETAIVPSVTGGVANSGDLLVLTSNPAAVLDFPVSAFGNFPITPTTLLPQTGVPLPTTPGGLAFWPVDNSLLITDQTGNTVRRYSCCSSPITAMTAFTSDYPNLGGSGLNMFKIKAGTQSGGAFAFVAQAGSVGHLLEFSEGSDGNGFLLETIAPKGNHPEGLALTFVAQAAENACTPPGCDPTGLITHTVVQNCNPKGNNCTPPIVENICVVPQDPRWTLVQGTWTYSAQPLPVNSVCPGFDNTGNMVIPAYARGQSGDAATPMGFTLVQTQVDDSQFNDTIVDNETTTFVANEPVCRPSATNNPTLATVLWAPLRGQGTYYFDGTTNEMGDLTSGCGTGRAASNGGSMWGLGLALDLSAPGLQNGGGSVGALAVLGDNKHQDLETTVQTVLASVITNNTNGVNVGTLLSNNNTTGCVPLSKAYFDYAQLEPDNPTSTWQQDLTIAADLLSNADTSANPITCDSIVTTYLPAFGQSTGSPPVYNSSGQVRSRLANLYFTINSRILGNQPNGGSVPSWPPSPAPLAPPGGYNNACMGTGSTQYPPPGGCPTLNVPATVQAGTSLTASYTLNGLNAGCTLTSGDGTFASTPAPPNAANPPAYPFSGSQVGTVPVTTAPGNYTYTLSCPFPSNAVTPNVSVSATVNVTAATAPTLTVPSPVAAGSTFTVAWSLYGYGTIGCSLNSNGGDTTFTGVAVSGSGPNNSGSQLVTATSTAGTYTYTLMCPASSAVPTATTTLTVTAPSTPLSVKVSPTRITDDGQVATITWTAPSSGCKLTDSSTYRRGPGGTLSGTTSSNGAGSFTASYKSGEPDGGYTLTFTASCTSGGSASAQLSVTE